MDPMRAVLAAKFWNAEVESTRSLDALVYAVPHEPPALGLLRGSKLSRSQQLLLLQRQFAVPFVPSLEPPNKANDNTGGVVLDRVIANAGGSSWWATITGRARAQRFWWLEKQRRPDSTGINDRWWQRGWQRGRRLLNSSLYALSMRSRMQLGSHTILSTSAELDTLEGLLPDARQHDSGVSESRPLQSPWNGRASLRHQGKGHDWILESAYHGHFVDSDARFWDVPQVTTLDLASSESKAGGLRYRLGLHHSRGDPVECPKEEGTVVGDVPLGASPGLRAQGAFSLEKNVHLWKKTGSRRKLTKPYSLLAARPHITVSGIAGGLLCAKLGSRGEQLPREDWDSALRFDSNHLIGSFPGFVSADLFTSLGITAQFGLFQRLFVDHTKIAARLDVGAASSLMAATRHWTSDQHESSEAGQILRSSRFPTVALSLQQQLVGPIRARVDSRFTLDPADVTSRPPKFQEVTYGVDFSLERLGAAKIVVWYSPDRKEGMAELRVLER